MVFVFLYFQVLVLGQFYSLWMSFRRLGLAFWLTEAFICYFWLYWDLVAARRLSLRRVGVPLRCAVLGLLLRQNPGSRHMRFSSCGARALELSFNSCSTGCGLFLDEGLNLCPLHRQAASHPLHHPESPVCLFLMKWIDFLSLLPHGSCFLCFKKFIPILIMVFPFFI